MVEEYKAAASALLERWPALSMAVQHSFGGQYSSEKAEWLKRVTCDFITQNQSSKYLSYIAGFNVNQEYILETCRARCGASLSSRIYS